MDKNLDLTLTPFERIRHVDEDDLEFWSARDLMPTVEYELIETFP